MGRHGHEREREPGDRDMRAGGEAGQREGRTGEEAAQ